MRFERHARTQFISSKSTLVNFQQAGRTSCKQLWNYRTSAWHRYCHLCFLSKLLYPSPNPFVRLLGSQGLKRLSVQMPNVKRLRQKTKKLYACVCRFDLSAANNLSNRIPHHSTHSFDKVRFRPHSRAKSLSFSSFSHLCRVAFESVTWNEFFDWK